MNLRSVTLSAATLAVACCAFTASALADSYAFTITTPGSVNALTASGVLNTAPDANNAGVQDITSISMGMLTNGALTGNNAPQAITLLAVQPGQSATQPSVDTFDAGYDPTVPGESYFYLEYDNYLYKNGPVLDGNGLGFLAGGCGYEIGLDGNGYAYEAFDTSENFDQRTYGANAPAVDITITPLASSVTPEPAPIALLGTGLLGIAGLVRRRI